MKAVYVSEPGKLEVIEKEIPQLKTSTQVLVKITAAGICGSDIHIFHGTHAYATYPRILGRYVREQGVLSLEEAVRKMTSLPARKIRLRNKGVIAEGYDADLVVFDPDTVIDKNSYDDPRVHPAGIAHVLVNGVFVVEDAALTGARPGRVIRD